MLKEGFKRINFFKGFFTHAEDWQAAQQYDLDKRKIHNRHLHSPGVIEGCLDNLKVTATDEGTSLIIRSGYAIDGEGHDLYKPSLEKIDIISKNYNLPATVYVIIRYEETKIDKRSNVENPEYTNYAFIKEWPVVEIITDEPDNRSVIELARIHITRDAAKVRNPKVHDNPQPNEIDTKHVIKSGGISGRAGLKDFGVLVKDAETRVAAGKDPMPLEDDTNVLIERVEEEDAQRFYFVSAYPSEEARIIWRIESSFENGVVEYRLYFKNFGETAADVSYQVYRIY